MTALISMKKRMGNFLAAFLCVLPVYAFAVDISSIPLATYSAASSTDVKPNVLFVLDGSGSMAWDFMPDWACTTTYSTIGNRSCTNGPSQPQPSGSGTTEWLFKNAAYNGIYYNPAITYTPPVAVDPDGSLDTATYQNMSGVSAATGANPSDPLPNWEAVKDDAYWVQAQTYSNLQAGTGNAPFPYFFTIVPGEYCKDASLTNCVTSGAATTDYPVAAKVRWCNSSSLSTCRATFDSDSSYTYPRAASPYAATIRFSISNSSSATVTAVNVNGVQISTGSTSASDSNTLASDVAALINSCESQSSCAKGYVASSSSNTVTIYSLTQISSGPSVSGNSNFNYSTNAISNNVPGTNVLTIITPAITSYPYPGTLAKAATRTDCVGTTCTYDEEMTNYANWWTYYRTRMQMMKTAASNTFASIDTPADIAAGTSRFRLGFMTIDVSPASSRSGSFLNIGDFTGTQKYKWYQTLIKINPTTSTPLRTALATAGKLYAGVLDGDTLGGVSVTDPVEYSCQQNYTILSTDGFWNETQTPTKLDGSTEIGEQDGTLGAPYADQYDLQETEATSDLYYATGTLQKGKISRRGGVTWQDATSCTADNKTTACQYKWTSGQLVVPSSSLAPGSPVCTDNYTPAGSTGTYIAPTAGNPVTMCYYNQPSSPAAVSSCTSVPQSSGPQYYVTHAVDCEYTGTGGVANTLADVAAYYYKTDLRTGSPDSSADTTGTCTGPVIPPATTPNDLCANDVPTSGRDNNTAQHMTTFTLGLGAQGKMVYAPTDGKDYWNDKSGDFYSILTGATADPTNGICSWMSSSSTCIWPAPVSNKNSTIDDLWHAAVNGRGTYFSAANPSSLASSLTNTLTTISNVPRPGTAAAAATSNPNVTQSDNLVFTSFYESVQWYGELTRQEVDSSGILGNEEWSAANALDCAMTPWMANFTYQPGDVYSYNGGCYIVNTPYVTGSTQGDVDTKNSSAISITVGGAPVAATPLAHARRIYTRGDTSATDKTLIPFQWTSLSADQAYFEEPYITYTPASGSTPSSGLSQFCSPYGDGSSGGCLTKTQQTANTIADGGAAGEALVDFLAGSRTNEANMSTPYFRQRTHILGDIVSSQAAYVKTPIPQYKDANYTAFKNSSVVTSRVGTVFVGANDGMLHAFDVTTGQEDWAYIPSFVLPNLYKLADPNYTTQHQFYVDGSPQTGDICPNAPTSTCSDKEWETILVGGLNDGGKGYYALNITDPNNPTFLWEFTSADMGYSYGNPIITKLADGTWVVIVTSGYNNADGVGHLYVLNASNGQLLRDISTGVTAGLARISAHVLSPDTDNTATAVYGGDTAGNLWRFDINNNIGAPGYDAQLLVSFKDADGNPQPITTKPAEATINGSLVVFVGTGRYLGTTDVSDTGTQSFYAVKDNLGSTTYGNPRIASNMFVQQTFSDGTCPDNAPSTVCTPGQAIRTSSNNPVNWATNNGWYVDFLTDGERSVSDAQLQLGTLGFTTITPQTGSANACSASLSSAPSYLYALNYATGGAVDNSYGISAVSLGAGYATGVTYIELQNGTVVALVRTANGTSINTSSSNPPVNPPGVAGTRRVSWRVIN